MILSWLSMGEAVKLAPRAENLMERIALIANLVPRPLLDTQIAFTAARAIMVAAEVGLFEALGKGNQTAEAVAAVCGTDPKATKHLLECLVGIGYASWRDGKYDLPASMRKWLLRSSPSSVVAKLAFQSIEWDLVGKIGEFVRNGKPLDFHSHMNAQEWAIKMFNVTSHDFGPVARGAKCEFRFQIKNIYEEDAHISSVKSSCGCTTPQLTKNDLKTFQTAEVVAEFNTRDFLG